jgi:Uma2 family endonuclease
MSTTTHLITADELMRLPDDGHRYELVKGELLTMSPAGGKHGAVAMKLSRILANYIEEKDLGIAFTAETGFQLEHDPDTVLAPDFAFVSKERLSAPPEGYVVWAPDLVVEVISPTQSARSMKLKAQQWIQLGSDLVWVVYPNTRTVETLRENYNVVLTEADVLDGFEVLPGFRMSLKNLFQF